MKFARIVLPFFLILISTLNFAQTGGKQPDLKPTDTKPGDAKQTNAPQSEAQKFFKDLKSLAGTWEGDYEGTPLHVSFRVTSSGHALTHEATSPGRPEDPLTVFYLEGDRLLLTHFCDAGNRPFMQGKMLPDGKTLEFDLIDVADYKGRHGHMQQVVITILDADHHLEDWIYFVERKPPVHAHYDLRRTKTEAASAQTPTAK
jgi:hypothetical protein